MNLTMSIPALLFPAISLTMLAYNARYLAIAALIRQLHKEYQNSHEKTIGVQIKILSKRLTLIRATQASAILSFMGSVLTMLLLFLQLSTVADIVFIVSLSCMMISLILLFIEIQVSTNALQVQLKDMEV
ncbi:DUF2721 domain-containing protein [Wenyingzhuangia sp. 2_MG-2023]|uniref:DUF2721 domain-containing protein n=1 Tax=Wenyingzhuangia sp. 2_MG-2023 TaxID=3062639 RepID=UPI0026E43446|nr:DUF2721 domain-containing protein [Wenyingzhuangia sp. 2_MG-2023]MDO6737994.1 DUF2721 domain-containing protein [Wenyingzhuangia sp. 2_MG-2023]MDO6802653.1 DUF2721 domain-containing protein [Wenyingzhuangia sp. 1_MG-2023]